MKKNYIKPSLLSETFVAENVMNGDVVDLSSPIALYYGGRTLNITLDGENTLQTIALSDFIK